MKFRDLTEIGSCLGIQTKQREISGFSIDSRAVKKGDLFFALRGEHFDGHDFLEEVAKKGGVAAVVENNYSGNSCGLLLLKVENVLQALHHLAQYIQSKRNQKIIGITGSVGKTTTKEFTATLLSEKFTVSKTPGNNNSQIGLPLAILNQSGQKEIFVAEMGMTQSGHIENLVKIAPPEIGLITKVGYIHIDGFPLTGLEGIAKAKMEIFSQSTTKLAIFNRQILNFKACQILKQRPHQSYSLEDIQARYGLEKGWNIREDQSYSPSFSLPFSELHFCEDFLGAVVVARALGLTWDEIICGAQKLKPVRLRFERIEKNGIVFLNDTYNNSPESMEAALKSLPSPGYGAKVIGVFGEMRCLGDYSEERHRFIGSLAAEKLDHLLCFGKGCLPMLEVFHKSGKPVEMFHDLKSLKSTLFEILKKGDVVLLRGSNDVKFWQILES